MPRTGGAWADLSAIWAPFGVRESAGLEWNVRMARNPTICGAMAERNASRSRRRSLFAPAPVGLTVVLAIATPALRAGRFGPMHARKE